jgi:hypothetical protein
MALFTKPWYRDCLISSKDEGREMNQRLAILVMYYVLESIYYNRIAPKHQHEEQEIKLAVIVGGINPVLNDDVPTQDPAYWHDWTRILMEQHMREPLSNADVLKAIIVFVSYYRDTFEFDLQPTVDILNALSPDGPEMTEAIEKAKNDKDRNPDPMIANHVLPLGSVVKLKEGDGSLLVIVGRAVLSQKDGDTGYFDYAAVQYVRGITADGKFIFFNDEDIAEVVFEGYRDDDEMHYAWRYQSNLAKSPYKKLSVTQ